MLFGTGSPLWWMTSAGPVGGVRRDGPGSVYVPTTVADFVALGLPSPTRLWTCQEASGDLIDVVASLALTANGAPSYQNTVAGWSRKFVGFATGTASQRFQTTDAALDVAAGQSMAWLLYASVDAPAGASRYLLTANAAANRLVITTAGLPSTVHNGVAATGAVNHGAIGTVRPWLWYRNGTSNASGTMTEQEHVVGTHDETVQTGQAKALGAAGASTVTEARIGLAAVWVGATAETAAVKATLTTLGWSVLW